RGWALSSYQFEHCLQRRFAKDDIRRPAHLWAVNYPHVSRETIDRPACLEVGRTVPDKETRTGEIGGVDPDALPSSAGQRRIAVETEVAPVLVEVDIHGGHPGIGDP